MRKHPKHRNHTNPNHHIRPLSADRLERILYGESLPDKHSKERLQQARKEIIMPDIKTAMENALKSTINEWADDDKPVTQTQTQTQTKTETQPKEKAMPNPQPTYNVAHLTPSKVRFVPTVGVSEAVFNYVRDNPGKSRDEITKALLAKGFKKSSLQSLVGQFLRSDYFIKDANDKIHTAIPAYKPLPSTAKQIRYFKAKQMALKKRAPKTITLVTKKPKAPKAEGAGIAALKVDTVEKATALPLPVNKFEPGALIDSLSVMQARELYDMLKKIFGG